ncbi:TPA: hypothetical protein ACH3X1_016484 [Trebouxia sp. C0004]
MPIASKEARLHCRPGYQGHETVGKDNLGPVDDRRGQAAETYMQPGRLYATVEVVRWMSALLLKETVNIASEVHSNALRGPPSYCL